MASQDGLLNHRCHVLMPMYGRHKAACHEPPCTTLQHQSGALEALPLVMCPFRHVRCASCAVAQDAARSTVGRSRREKPERRASRAKVTLEPNAHIQQGPSQLLQPEHRVADCLRLQLFPAVLHFRKQGRYELPYLLRITQALQPV